MTQAPQHTPHVNSDSSDMKDALSDDEWDDCMAFNGDDMEPESPNGTTDDPLSSDLDAAFLSEPKDTEPSVNDPFECRGCGGRYTRDEHSQLSCKSCGEMSDMSAEHDQYSTAMEQHNRSSGHGHMPLRMVGKGATQQQHLLMSTATGSSRYHSEQGLQRWIRINEAAKEMQCPRIIIKSAAALFEQVRESSPTNFRADGRLGIFAACLYWCCQKYETARTPQQVCNMMNIKMRYFTRGLRNLNTLCSQGNIELPKESRTRKLVKLYLQRLEIHQIGYENFLTDLVEYSESQHVYLVTDSKIATKCLGAVLLLTERIKTLRHLKAEDLEKTCGISRATFIRSYNALKEHSKIIQRVFKRHKIPMPRAWRRPAATE